MNVVLKVADQIWLATALLHREQPAAADFSVQEILRRAEQIGPYRPSLATHVSRHCVANLPPAGAGYRMLFATARGRRRLYRAGDPCDKRRAGQKTCPRAEDLPADLRPLLAWYANKGAEPSPDASLAARRRRALQVLRNPRPSRLSKEQMRYVAESHDLDFGG